MWLMPKGPRISRGSNVFIVRFIVTFFSHFTRIKVKIIYFRDMKDQLQEAIDEILTPNKKLTSDSINYFIWIANRAQTKYRLADINGYFEPIYYKKFTKKFSNYVQILFDHSAEHFICIFYKFYENTVYVYDSLFRKKLNDTQKRIIKILYPLVLSINIKFVEPKTIQPDYDSCGVFSIAYATTIILGKDPRDVSLQLNKTMGVDESMILRNHIKDIITSERLTSFQS